MPPVVDVVGAEGALKVLGIRLIGLTAENGKKLLLTVMLLALLWLLFRGLKAAADFLLRHGDLYTRFWLQQAINLVHAFWVLLGLLSIWFDDPARLATGFGLVSAGLAFALRRVVTAVAGYFIILRGRIFNLGDRISMGGVRGDVIALGYTRTTVMEIGQPPAVEIPDPAMWVRSRQYTGRVVTITNDKVFDEPVYNYTREFPYLWEELLLPVRYSADRHQVEKILLEVAGRHTVKISEMGEAAIEEMARRYSVSIVDLHPRVYYRITDNWLELTVRFIARDRGVRELKDTMSREILTALDEAGIDVASATLEIVGVPPLRMKDGSCRVKEPG